ncbi:hypothetical protein J7E97_32270 [Streptomyces sp. ISL-66]|uniref:hypothetical protein n=1 Tax=Streptomyces sp. ISL-66 TaxID=2819186 RepID=UPI001BE95287|nr:hypothetical protein [Streptomyces sp. ISL-66]MBT2472400.1 hypothetical protein [Streptomyces sp. ISL-66]
MPLRRQDRAVAPGTFAMLPAGEEITPADHGTGPATVLAVFSRSEFTAELPRGAARGAAAAARATDLPRRRGGLWTGRRPDPILLP